MRLTDAEWSVMDILWSVPCCSLGEIASALKTVKGWSKNTVHTYLTRMAAKGLVAIDHGSAKPYSAIIARDDIARQERDQLLHKVYGGAAGDLIAAFLKESSISKEEAASLRQLLDEMEV